MGVEMKRFGYFLIFLLAWGQAVDDVLAVALPSASAPRADENDDEYLPSQCRLREEDFVEEPAFVGLELHPADTPLLEKGMPFEWNLATPFSPPQLYVLMSLQI